MRFYHCSEQDYKLNDIIQKGHWKHYVANQNGFLKEFEDLFEKIRFKKALSKVSRMDCIFAFDNENYIDSFIINNPKYHAYEIEIVDNISYTAHNYEVISYFLKYMDLDFLFSKQDLIELYWIGNENSCYQSGQKRLEYIPEILIDGNATVIKKY